MNSLVFFFLKLFCLHFSWTYSSCLWLVHPCTGTFVRLLWFLFLHPLSQTCQDKNMSCRFEALLFEYITEEITAYLSFFFEVLCSLDSMAHVSLRATWLAAHLIIDEQLHIQRNLCAQCTCAMLEAILRKNTFSGPK